MTFCIASLLLGGKKGGISLLVLCVSSLCSPGSLAVSESHPSIFFPRYCFASQKPSQANRTQHQPGIFQPKKMKRTPLKTNPDSLLLARANAVITHPSFHKQSHPIPSHPIPSYPTSTTTHSHSHPQIILNHLISSSSHTKPPSTKAHQSGPTHSVYARPPPPAVWG